MRLALWVTCVLVLSADSSEQPVSIKSSRPGGVDCIHLFTCELTGLQSMALTRPFPASCYLVSESGGVGGGGGHLPSLKGLQALIGFQRLGSRPQPSSTPQGCADNGTSVILGGTRGGGGGRSLTWGGGVRKGVGLGGGGGLGVMVRKSSMSDV